MSHSKSLFLGPHLPDECTRVLDCVFFSSNELRNLACGTGGKKKALCSRVCVCETRDRIFCLYVELYPDGLSWFVLLALFIFVYHFFMNTH